MRVHIDEQSLSYLRRFTQQEDEALRAARARSEEADIPAVAPETGALLRWFAHLLNARHVAEVGTGGGYSGLWLLGGMDPRGTLTSVDADPDHHALAQRAFGDAGLLDRVRLMTGAALQVLPKLADHHYDIVFLDAAKSEYPAYLEHARRLLRPGGVLIADNVLWHGKVADPLEGDDDTSGIREFNDQVREDPTLLPVLLPVGDGVLCAVYQPLEQPEQP
ncbi:MAG TPA: O-methyltransferase [Egibacteraceae bacterium]|nr:O-methyltransferase [Egibacteraceae bacterium]